MSHAVLERVYRREYGRVVSMLAARVGLQHVDVVEDAVQAAWTTALSKWPKDGVPRRPAAWLFRAAHNGVDVFRVFDAMNDMRNIERALAAVKNVGKHAQGTIAYTLSPVHTLDTWLDQGKLYSAEEVERLARETEEWFR